MSRVEHKRRVLVVQKLCIKSICYVIFVEYFVLYCPKVVLPTRVQYSVTKKNIYTLTEKICFPSTNRFLHAWNVILFLCSLIVRNVFIKYYVLSHGIYVKLIDRHEFTYSCYLCSQLLLLLLSCCSRLRLVQSVLNYREF